MGHDVPEVDAFRREQWAAAVNWVAGRIDRELDNQPGWYVYECVRAWAVPIEAGTLAPWADELDTVAEHWRVGTKIGKNLYRVTNEHLEEDIGRMDTPELAAVVVKAVNRLGVHGPGQVRMDPAEPHLIEFRVDGRELQRAVAPLIAARVRAECVPAIIGECNRTRQATREQVAEEIAQDLLQVVGREGGLWAAVIARAHRTTSGDDHA